MLAHAGHWITSLLYFAPVLVLVGFLVIQSRRERRRARDDR
jgi:cytochrome c-type biogenesis protein CcmH/NrfF